MPVLGRYPDMVSAEAGKPWPVAARTARIRSMPQPNSVVQFAPQAR